MILRHTLPHTGVIPTTHLFLTAHQDLYNAHKGAAPPALRISALDSDIGCFGWRKLVLKPILLSSLYDLLLKNFQSLLVYVWSVLIKMIWSLANGVHWLEMVKCSLCIFFSPSVENISDFLKICNILQRKYCMTSQLRSKSLW